MQDPRLQALLLEVNMHHCCLLGSRTECWSGSSGQQSPTGHRAEAVLLLRSGAGFPAAAAEGSPGREKHLGHALVCPSSLCTQALHSVPAYPQRAAGPPARGWRRVSCRAGNQRWSVAVSAPALPSRATWLLCHRSFHSSHSTSMFNHQHLKCSPCRQGGGSPFSIVAMPGHRARQMEARTTAFLTTAEPTGVNETPS